jgi:hypothetical protein
MANRVGNRANGRSAIVIVAGLLAFYATPSKACEGANCGRIVLAQNDETQTETAPATQPSATKLAKHKSRHAQASSRRRTAELDSKTTAAKKKAAQTDEPSDAHQDNQDAGKLNVSPAVANANARMSPPTDTGDGVDTAVSASQQASATTSDQTSDTQIVSSDELNDLDRAAVEEKPVPKILRPVSITYQVASNARDDAWSQTSLIGKIFIAFGGFLTLASAARMFMA